jgi:hypothetical protein
VPGDKSLLLSILHPQFPHTHTHTHRMQCTQSHQPEDGDWRQTTWKRLVPYLPYSQTQTCIFCGKMGVMKDNRRMWPVCFLYQFLDSTCKPTPFVHMVLMSLIFQSLKQKTWREDTVLLCKDCLDWALEVCWYNEECHRWCMNGKKLKFKRRVSKNADICAFLPMDLLLLFLHAPSEQRQLEYRMMCRLLTVLSKTDVHIATLGGAPATCLYAHMPFPILQAVIHNIQTGHLSLRKKKGTFKSEDNHCAFYMSQSIAMNVVLVCHKASGEKRLVRNAPDVAKYIRKCSSLLTRHKQKQKAWEEWNVHGFDVNVGCKRKCPPCTVEKDSRHLQCASTSKEQAGSGDSRGMCSLHTAHKPCEQEVSIVRDKCVHFNKIETLAMDGEN